MSIYFFIRIYIYSIKVTFHGKIIKIREAGYEGNFFLNQKLSILNIAVVREFDK